MPDQERVFTPCYWGALAVLALLLLALCYQAIVVGDVALYDENGFMENLQIVLLSIGCVGFMRAAVKQQHRHRVLASFFALLFFLFIFREFELEEYDAPAILIYLLAEDGRIFPLLILLGLFALVLKELRFYFRHFRVYLFSRTGFSIAVAALILLLFAQTFDRKWVVVPYLSFFEELSEVAAYFFLMLAGGYAARDLQHLQHNLGE